MRCRQNLTINYQRLFKILINFYMKIPNSVGINLLKKNKFIF